MRNVMGRRVLSIAALFIVSAGLARGTTSTSTNTSEGTGSDTPSPSVAGGEPDTGTGTPSPAEAGGGTGTGSDTPSPTLFSSTSSPTNFEYKDFDYENLGFLVAMCFIGIMFCACCVGCYIFAAKKRNSVENPPAPSARAGAGTSTL